MSDQNEKTILAYVSQYKSKYYFNEEIGILPETVKKELLMNMIFITEEAGGVCELGFYPNGEVYIDTYGEEDDLGYDQISGRLLVSEMEHKEHEMLEQLQVWYLTMMRKKASR